MIRLFDGEYAGVNIRVLPGGKKIQLLECILLPCGGVIPPGFVCDLDSIPRFVGWVYALLKGRTTLGAIIHDYYYKNRKGRVAGDEMFLRVMEWERTRRRYRVCIYHAVKILGRFHYPG